MADNPNSRLGGEALKNYLAESTPHPITPRYIFGWVRDKSSPQMSVWVLDDNPEAYARIQAVYDADPTLTSKAEAIQRAGGTFYKWCMCRIPCNRSSARGKMESHLLNPI